MGADAERDDDDSGLDRYWRRRALTLAGVLGGVGLLAWACTGGGGAEEGRGPLRNAAAAGSANPSEPLTVPPARPTVTVTATTKVTATPKAERRDGDACEPDAVVIAMTATRDVYGRGERPRFRLTATNIGKHACTFDVGPRSLDVRITSGTDRIWSSAHCERNGGSSIQMLRHGIPYVGTLTWDRRRSADHCRGERESARPGTYVATIKGVEVKKQVFRLR